MISTRNLVKIPTVYASVVERDVIDGARVVGVEHDRATESWSSKHEVRLRFEGEHWGEWTAANRQVSVWR